MVRACVRACICALSSHQTQVRSLDSVPYILVSYHLLLVTGCHTYQDTVGSKHAGKSYIAIPQNIFYRMMVTYNLHHVPKDAYIFVFCCCVYLLCTPYTHSFLLLCTLCAPYTRRTHNKHTNFLLRTKRVMFFARPTNSGSRYITVHDSITTIERCTVLLLLMGIIHPVVRKLFCQNSRKKMTNDALLSNMSSFARPTLTFLHES